MRARIAVILASLLLGAATTVAFAWWIAWPEYASSQFLGRIEGRYMSGPDDRAQLMTRIRRFGALRIEGVATWTHSQQFSRTGYQQVERLPAPSWAEVADGPEWTSATVAYGWPCLALRGTWLITPDHQARRSVHEYPGYLTEEDFPSLENHPLPIGPLWPGLIANSLLYALAWWLLILAFASAARPLMRHRRRSRGQCAKCGYDLKGLDAGAQCPECGHGERRSATSVTAE